MPKPDTDLILINAKSGQTRPNKSWVLGRIWRDWRDHPYDPNYALCVSVLQTSTNKDHGTPDWDVVWYTGVATILVQAGIAAIPGILYGAWEIMVVTLCGTFLALVSSAQPEWRTEKWPARYLGGTSKETRRLQQKTVCLTGGNGSNRVIVIKSNGNELDLEDLALARSNPGQY